LSASEQAEQSTATQTPQQPTNPQVDCEAVKKTLGLTEDFLEVADTRDSLNAEIARLEQRIQDLNSRIPRTPSEKQLEKRRHEYEKLEAKKNRTDEEEFELATTDVSDIRSKESLQKELADTAQTLAIKKLHARCTQQTISSIYSPVQAFKKTMSMFFAALIGLVIIGFFVLSYKDENIRRAIFSGQTGIQFLTLFSIVIAIILFGITSILQDKELAALLGGLSGYILGRYSSPGQSSG
jgi:hypothetical protein